MMTSDRLRWFAGGWISPQCAGISFAILILAGSHARAAEIPEVDLGNDQGHFVVVDREAGQYLGHPTTVLLEDGKTIVTVYPRGHGKGAIVLKKSRDGGQTWSDRMPTPENWSTSKETPTIHRVVDASGKKRLILFSGLYPIRESVSEDDGETWTPLAPIGDFGGIVAMGSVERLKDGRYLALFHDDGRFFKGTGKNETFRVYKTISADGGLTWGSPEVIVDVPDRHYCEPGLVRSPDGKQLAVLLRENSRKHASAVIFSDDEGATWTKPRDLPESLTGDRHTGKYAPDGRLFLSFRDMGAKSPTKGDWVGWIGTYDDLVRGRDGQYRVRLRDNTKGADCAYPGVEVLPDGTFVVTTYGHWDLGKPPYILAARFKLDELDRLVKIGPLPSWNEEGSARRAIVSFVTRVTNEGGPEFVPAAERIATFDNDGTLWSEQPLYFQFSFAIDRVKALADRNPDWRTRQPFKAALEGDVKGIVAEGERGVVQLLAASHAGMTTDAFASIVADWQANARHPRFNRLYTELVYQPMLELLAYLHAHGFKIFIVSGGGAEFIRGFSEKVYGIPPERVIGSLVKVEYQTHDDRPELLRLGEQNFLDDKAGKPVGIQNVIGRRPILAFGNSDGDYEMLRWTTAGKGPRLGLIVHHTDADREWAYDRDSLVGKLSRALDEAPSRGWPVVDMKMDWKRIYPFEAGVAN